MFDPVCPFLNVDLHLEKQLRDLPPGAELWSHLRGGKNESLCNYQTSFSKQHYALSQGSAAALTHFEMRYSQLSI